MPTPEPKKLTLKKTKITNVNSADTDRKLENVQMVETSSCVTTRWCTFFGC
jgi:hypothetical protein